VHVGTAPKGLYWKKISEVYRMKKISSTDTGPPTPRMVMSEKKSVWAHFFTILPQTLHDLSRPRSGGSYLFGLPCRHHLGHFRGTFFGDMMKFWPNLAGPAAKKSKQLRQVPQWCLYAPRFIPTDRVSSCNKFGGHRVHEKQLFGVVFGGKISSKSWKIRSEIVLFRVVIK